MKFLTTVTLVVLSSLVCSLAATTAELVPEITKLTSQTAALGSAIKALTLNDVSSALNTCQRTREVRSTIDALTLTASTVNPASIYNADAVSILSASQNLKQAVVSTVSDIAAKRDILQSISHANLVGRRDYYGFDGVPGRVDVMSPIAGTMVGLRIASLTLSATISGADNVNGSTKSSFKAVMNDMVFVLNASGVNATSIYLTVNE